MTWRAAERILLHNRDSNAPTQRALFRGKLGRARRRERDLLQPAPELTADRVRAESFFLPFENYDRDL